MYLNPDSDQDLAPNLIAEPVTRLTYDINRVQYCIPIIRKTFSLPSCQQNNNQQSEPITKLPMHR